MEFSQLRRIIHSTPKGANIIVEWERPCTTFKGVSCVITKRVKMIGRIGIEYDNQKKVIEARQEGSLPVENQGLRGMEWVEYPWLIRSIKSRKLYLRLYKGTSDKIKPSVSFFKDGIEVPKETIQHYLTAKELQSTENSNCFTCSVDSIISLNREKAYHVCVEISNELVMF
jgi:hypothetical protein